ncbi:VCBS repeat-containing protein [Candidatus Woesearchaeota archaeon]|nr:VCBS repeat-containing protein [Candidatus Woesearchaeota archaeon]
MGKFIAAMGLVAGLALPVDMKEVPHYSITEQTRFSVLHEGQDEKGMLSLNSKGIYLYEKQRTGYDDAKLVLPVKARSADRHWLGVGDFDKDGKEDLAYVVDHMLYVHQNTGGGFGTAYFIAGMPHNKSLTEQGITRDRENGFVADMDNDGLPDIVVNNSVGCYLFRNTGNSFESAKGPSVEFPRYRTEFGLEPIAHDWDNDGRLEILVGSSEGIFAAQGALTEKIAAVRTAPFTGEESALINDLSRVVFPFVPQYTFEDTIILRSCVINGERVPVAGTLFGFFALYPDKIVRLRLADEHGNPLDRLKLAASDHPDFSINEEIVYATKAGLFHATLKDGYYRQTRWGAVENAGMHDRAYLLLTDYDGLPQDYAVGTSWKLQVFNQ